MNGLYFRGHKIEERHGCWRFADTQEPVELAWRMRDCGHCGKPNTPEGHDGCLGTLPGVMNACCGHGQPQDAFVQFRGGTRLHDDGAIEFFKQSVQGWHYEEVTR